LEELCQPYTEDEVLAFLGGLYHLSRRGMDSQAIDSILRFFDQALIENKLEKCRETLRRLDPKKLDASMIKAVLVISGKARPWLYEERNGFFARAMASITAERGRQIAERLLVKHK
jgi:hypothetical protein